MNFDILDENGRPAQGYTGLFYAGGQGKLKQSGKVATLPTPLCGSYVHGAVSSFRWQGQHSRSQGQWQAP